MKSLDPEVVILILLFTVGIIAFIYDEYYARKEMKTVKVVTKHRKVIGGFMAVEVALIIVFFAL